MGTETSTETRTSLCAICDQPISISIVIGQQRWHDVAWMHIAPPPVTDDHVVSPELRICCDATCPACKYPEMGFAPARDEFVCSRCGHTQTERPKD